MGTWKPGAQRFRDSGAGGESGVVKCCRNSVSWLRLSVAMFTPRIMSRVSILRGIIIIVLLAALASAVRPCFTPTNKGNRNCSGGDNTNNNRSSETQLHARFAGTGEDFGRNFGLEAMQCVHIKYKLGAIL